MGYTDGAGFKALKALPGTCAGAFAVLPNATIIAGMPIVATEPEKPSKCDAVLSVNKELEESEPTLSVLVAQFGLGIVGTRRNLSSD